MIFKSITNWLDKIVGTRGPDRQITVYSRQGCTCCDKALAELEKARRRFQLNINIVDLDTDPALAAEHGMHVPVVAIDGKVRFKGQINPVLLERILKHPS